MYRGSYMGNENSGYIVPEGYDGTALSTRDEIAIEDEIHPSVITKSETKISGTYKEKITDSEECMAKAEPEKVGFLGGVKGFFKNNFFDIKLPVKFELEDFMILGLAIYLLFSKSGDKECAIMIALLLFL